jgi:cell wall-associated NlpC family hydrolase
MSEKILSVARSWLNSPWIHHQRAKGLGADCVGFINGVFDELGLQLPPIDNYRRSPENDELLVFIRSLPFLREKESIEAGNILVFKVGLIPHHVGFSNGEGLIHADFVVGKVVEVSSLGTMQNNLCGIFEIIL